MRHQRKGRKLKRTSSHKRALMRNMATALFEHKKISTTEAKAKELRPYAEKLITKAKRALANEQDNRLPEGQKTDIHNRRIVGREIRNKAVLQELFDAIAPAIEDRPGGYTRIIKTSIRRGDASRTAIIELVDWSAPQDGASSLKKKRKAKPKKAKPQETKPVEEEVIEEKITEDELEEETVDDTQEQETSEEATEAEAPLDEEEEKVEEEPAEAETKEAMAEEKPAEAEEEEEKVEEEPAEAQKKEEAKAGEKPAEPEEKASEDEEKKKEE